MNLSLVFIRLSFSPFIYHDAAVKSIKRCEEMKVMKTQTQRSRFEVRTEWLRNAYVYIGLSVGNAFVKFAGWLRQKIDQTHPN